MSFRDVVAMLQCLFYVNDLPGGEAHHDGGMKGRDPQAGARRSRMLALTADETAALDALRGEPKRTVVTEARPAKGTPNLTLADADARGRRAAGPGKAGVAARRIRSGLRRDREEVSEAAASSCRAI